MNGRTAKRTSALRKKIVPLHETTVAINPATGEKLAEYHVHTKNELKDAINRAREAHPAWAALPLKQRIKYMMKVRAYIVANMDKIAETISQDNGKTRIDAMGTEVLTAAMAVTYYAKNAPRFLKDRTLSTGNIMFVNKRSRIARVPFGVVGIISPWNYPFSIPFSEIIMALLAGNTVVFKAATETQAVGHILKDCIDAAGLPEHVFNYINMPGSLAGDAFLESGIDKLFFTGSVAIGKYLMKKASDTLTPLSLELGGNDPMIVLEDADLERAAAGAVWAGFQNSGQSCGGVERIYVQRKAYYAFLAILTKKIESLRVGQDTGFNTDIGAMTTKKQMDTVKLHISEALKKGANICAQSPLPKSFKGQFLPAMVLTEVDHTMMLMKDETFGPVVGVMPFDTEEEAVRLANDSYLGLTASVWSRSNKKAMRIGRQIKAGALTVNDHLMSHGLAEAPWGGFKQSGLGRTHGEIGFSEMTQPQVLVKDIMPLVKKNFWWHPFNRRIYEGIRGVGYVLYGKGPFIRLKGMAALLKVFPRTFFKS